MVMAGGGGRLGIHLGMHAAACEAGEAPDLVLGTCGGALVAALVHAEPDPARQLAYLAGPEMYRFWGSVKPKLQGGVSAALLAFAQRALDPRHAPRVPDLDADALFEVAGAWPVLDWRSDAAGPDAVLLGARLLPAAAHVGQARAGRALLELVAIGPERVRHLVSGTPSPVGSGPHAGSAVAPKMATLDTSALALADAVRISMTDMVYVPAAVAAGERWLGGAVDLMPVELAARMADEVWIDCKDAIPRWTMAAAWRAVLGIDALARQRQVDQTPVALRVDNRGLDEALPRSALHWQVALTRSGVQLRVQLRVHAAADEADYRRVMQAQFDEGRRRMRAALAARRSGAA